MLNNSNSKKCNGQIKAVSPFCNKCSALAEFSSCLLVNASSEGLQDVCMLCLHNEQASMCRHTYYCQQYFPPLYNRVANYKVKKFISGK